MGNKGATTDTKQLTTNASAGIAKSKIVGPLLPPGLNEWRGLSKAGTPWEVHRGDAKSVLATLESRRFDCAITSPPYFWQRDYKVAGQIGLEKTIDEYVASVTDIMEELRRVMKKTGLLFLNLGDTYYSAKGEPKGKDRKNQARRFGLRAVDKGGLGVPRKTAIGIPWRIAISMISAGWTLRSSIVWHRKQIVPEPTAKDRPWRSYEFIFMFSVSPKYHFDRSKLNGEEDIWQIPTRPSSGFHFATFPEQLVEKCLAIGCPKNGEMIDPFAGSGTALQVGLRRGHPVTGVDLSDAYCDHMVKNLKTL